MWRKKLVDLKRVQGTDLELSEFIDSGVSEKTVYKCNLLLGIRRLPFLISQKYTPSSHINTALCRACRITRTRTHTQIYIYSLSISIRR